MFHCQYETNPFPVNKFLAVNIQQLTIQSSKVYIGSKLIGQVDML